MKMTMVNLGLKGLSMMHYSTIIIQQRKTKLLYDYRIYHEYISTGKYGIPLTWRPLYLSKSVSGNFSVHHI